jgi:hypothetical protein
VPPVPQTGDAEHATIGRADEIRLLAVRHRLPFGVARRRNDAAVALSATLSARALNAVRPTRTVGRSLRLGYWEKCSRHARAVPPRRAHGRPARRSRGSIWHASCLAGVRWVAFSFPLSSWRRGPALAPTLTHYPLGVGAFLELARSGCRVELPGEA